MSVQLGIANKALAQLSRHDGLTELANRRYFDEYLAEQVAVAIRTKRPLAVLLCDVDHFKTYNDQYGHPAGDECLKQVAAALRSCGNRAADMVARYGGEEFALILPDTDAIGALRVGEAARVAVSGLKIVHARSTSSPHVSISAGVAVLMPDADMTARQLIAAADQYLYQAKAAGRNQVVGAPVGA
ncbi:MAG: diguanylate cyclase [Pseudomonadota bacterium]